MSRKHIVIVGGGFGGVKLALKLAKKKHFRVTLINDHKYFEYHAALYRSATGWSPNEVVVPLKDIFAEHSAVEVVEDRVTGIDKKHKRIKGKSGHTYNYDDLVIAVGLVTNYYGIEGMEEGSYNMGTISDAFQLRQHLRDSVVQQPHGQRLEFIVIGGGATGVELASELQVFVEELCKKEGVPTNKVHTTLIEGAKRVLPLLSPKASKYAEWRLEKLGVKVMLGARVSALKDNVLSVDGKKLKSMTVIWTAGATNNPLFEKHPQIFNLAPNKRVEVDEYLKADSHIYVIGDNANTKFSGMAQTALSDAVFLAKNFVKQSKNKELDLYSPKRPIYAVPVGREYAVIQWGSTVLRGRVAWFLRRVADLKLFVTFEPYHKAIRTWRSGNKRAKGYEAR